MEAKMKLDFKKIDAKNVKSIEIYTEDGPISIMGGADIDYIGFEILQYEGEEECVSIDEKDGVVKAKVETPKKWFTFGKSKAKTGFSLVLPDRLKIKAVAGFGDVGISSVKNDIHVGCGAGDVKVSNILGNTKIKSGTGAVTADALQGDLQITAGAGPVELTAVASKNIRVYAGTSNIVGKWHTEPLTKSAEFISGTGNIKLIFPPNTRIKHLITTGTGAIVDDFKQDPAAEFELKVVGGTGKIKVINEDK